MLNSPEFSIQEVVPGVSAIFGGICNRGIIASQGDVLVVDSGMSVAEATPLRAQADKLRNGGALTLFNTHPHPDHVFGNQVFADAPIVAQQGVRDVLVNAGEQVLAGIKQNPQMAARIGDIKLTPPTLTFQDQLTLFVGEIEVQLIYFGVAHSPSDSIAWLPQSKTLFTGDLLFNNLVPASPPGGSVANWISFLARLEQLGAEHVIPGHGPIQDPSALGVLRTWFETLYAQVKEAVEHDSSRETAIATLPARMQAIAPRMLEERFPRIIEVVYDEVLRTPNK
ncbi:MAG TPA: MBL fold metallo-hydrolase [Ktedonobacteraceae bacterium]|jgi:cyclase|nr:MBL fold metallo-hydrolase [Ktedonobacteraceae bacterium]